MAKKLEDGIRMKYIIHKADGSPCNPNACYFVLRLDSEGDPDFVEACRLAMSVFADQIDPSIPALASDIRACLTELDRPPCGCREAACPHESMFSSIWRYGEQ